MYDIKPLEKEWKQYQKKKKRPLYILLIVGLLLALIFIWKYKYIDFSKFMPSFEMHQDSNRTDSVKDVLINKQIEVLQIHKKYSIAKNKSMNNTMILKKENNISIPIIDKINVDNSNSIEQIVSKRAKENSVNIIVSEKPKTEKVHIEVHEKKKHLDIIKTSTLNAYKDVEKRFYQSYDTDDSLFLAKSYYRKGQYDKSEFWSLQTNKINSSIEESWLIFVKSKMKMGYKNEAIHILTNYAKKSNSSAAWNLLLELKK